MSVDKINPHNNKADTQEQSVEPQEQVSDVNFNVKAVHLVRRHTLARQSVVGSQKASDQKLWQEKGQYEQPKVAHFFEKKSQERPWPNWYWKL